MQDVTEAFVRAHEVGAWPVDRVAAAVPGDGPLADLRCEWDQDAGDDWLRLLHTSMVLALVWVPGPLVIATSGHHDLVGEIERLTATTVEQVAVAHLDAPVIAIRPDRLEEIWPGRDWPQGSVDASAMSAHDLWYATC
ncbi:MAG: hypothetical protein QOJ03_1225 [Frankiaceae bacterium]|nr:hypothetical protein [Frankiaceae bacterium]